MERTKFKGVKDSPLVGLYFIGRLTGDRRKDVCLGRIKSMIKDNYWYLLDLVGVQIVCNLSEMHEWRFYDDHKTFQSEVDKWCK